MSVRAKAIYKGINTNVKMKDGSIFEIQYHTPNSFNIKQNINHVLYEEYRLLDPTSNKTIEVSKIMKENSNSINRPKNVEQIK